MRGPVVSGNFNGTRSSFWKDSFLTTASHNSVLRTDSPESRAAEDSAVHAEAHDPSHVITKARARALTRQFAHFLRHSYGIGGSGPGRDIVVCVSSGQSALPCLFWGVIAAEGIYSAASSAGTPADIARQIRDGPGELLVCAEDLAPLGAAAAEAAGIPKRNLLLLRSYPRVELRSADGALACDFRHELEWPRLTDPNELENRAVCILYSSGTTGLPKGNMLLRIYTGVFYPSQREKKEGPACLVPAEREREREKLGRADRKAKGVRISHTNMVAGAVLSSQQSRPVFDRWEREGRPFGRRTLGHLPTAHIAGVQGYFVMPMYEGTCVYWMPKFNFDDFIAYCQRLEISHFFSVPPIFMAIAKHPAVRDQLRHIRFAVTGAAPLSGDLKDAAEKKLPDGAYVSQFWGLSETTGTVTGTPPDMKLASASLGFLLPNVTMR